MKQVRLFSPITENTAYLASFDITEHLIPADPDSRVVVSLSYRADVCQLLEVRVTDKEYKKRDVGVSMDLQSCGGDPDRLAKVMEAYGFQAIDGRCLISITQEIFQELEHLSLLK